MPVDPSYRECFEQWVAYLREVEFFGDTDPVFPKAEIGLKHGSFARIGFARSGYANTGKLNGIIRDAFARVQLPQFTPHAFRKTLAIYGDGLCRTREQFKAWSMNLGHEHMATTIDSYIPVSRDRQGELIRSLGHAPYRRGR